jgi:hypothetical protein
MAKIRRSPRRTHCQDHRKASPEEEKANEEEEEEEEEEAAAAARDQRQKRSPLKNTLDHKKSQLKSGTMNRVL